MKEIVEYYNREINGQARYKAYSSSFKKYIFSHNIKIGKRNIYNLMFTRKKPIFEKKKKNFSPVKINTDPCNRCRITFPEFNQKIRKKKY